MLVTVVIVSKAYRINLPGCILFFFLAFVKSRCSDW